MMLTFFGITIELKFEESLIPKDKEHNVSGM